MDDRELRFHKIDPNKTAVCFTFDDNFARHSGFIAPAFLSRGYRCTFYINAGADDFTPHINSYKALLAQGFELGSHGFVHDNLTELAPADVINNLRASAQRIHELFHVYPATFAFPYHGYTDQTLAMARALHLETRNTLAHSLWFAIKTAIPLGDMLTAVEQCIEKNRPLVFSGHSVLLTPKEADNEQLKKETGYNPILLDDLCKLLDFIKLRYHEVQVLTFEQASVLAYIKQSGEIDGDTFILSQTHMDRLKAFGIGTERLTELV